MWHYPKKVKPYTKELISLLFRHIIAFAILFFALGAIMFQLTNKTIYHQVDTVINQTMDKAQYLGKKSVTPLPEHINSKYALKVILWGKNGQPITRSNALREYMKNKTFKVRSEELGHIVSKTESSNDHKNPIYYRTLIQKTPTNHYGIQYIEVAVITNQIHETLISLHEMMIIFIVIFWTLSLIISYILAKHSMRPIISSWEKQQEFVENASHELKTPLAVIQAKLEQLFMYPKHTIMDEAENISIALNEVRRLNRLTSDLTALTRTDYNNKSLQYQHVDVSQFMTEIYRTYEELSTLNHRHLELIDHTHHEQVNIDPQLIKQLFAILIDNAMKYTNDDGHIWLESMIHNNQWIIMVKDDGIGVSDHDKKRLFERFYRVDSSRTRETGGSGLGLSLAKWIIDCHNGNIKVIDRHPKGLIMKITLPIK